MKRDVFNPDTALPPECLEELRSCDRNALAFAAFEKREKSFGEVIDINRFSTYEKLIKSTAYVLLFLGNLKRRVVEHCAGTGRRDSEQSPVVTEELRSRADLLWIKETQHGRIKKEWKLQFRLFLDDLGLWRCKGRLENAELSYSSCYPIVLPKDHYFSLLIVQRAHHRVSHSGVKDTLTELRSRFWIPQGRSFVRQFISRCVVCRRYASSCYKAPPPPPLPDYRVRESSPFTAIGVDYAGPLVIKHHAHTPYHITHTQNQRVQNAHTTHSGKAWVCLFTCCTSRAVHSELVTDLSPLSFIRCFKRFISRRGIPSHIISDNGSTFKAAAKELKKILDHPQVKHFMSDVHVKWSFNVERAPWWGGFFERMVQLMKRC